jgi:DNA topoisomerase-1
MPRTLLIVESPNKARKIQGFLGRDVTVRASVGHVCDLPQKEYGVDLETLEERYEVRNAKVVGELRALVRSGGYDTVLLGTDPDREGEAIAWHLARELRLGRGERRVEFREITAAAVRAALARPRAVDTARVDAQRARRVLDRVVGFDVSSEICWPAGASSAGRVQTPALHILCEREREILAFVAETYWTLAGRYGEGFEAVVPATAAEIAAGEGGGRQDGPVGGREARLASGVRGRTAGGVRAGEADGDDGQEFDDAADADESDRVVRGGPPARGSSPENPRRQTPDARQLRARRFPTREEAERTRAIATRHDHVVRAVDRRRTQRRPDPPYTTSTLQQDASRKLRLSAKQAADQAQALFEAGLITYHRTDSVRVSAEAAEMARAYIGARHPDALPDRPPQARTKAGAQDAHEAIRPTQLEGHDAPPAGTDRLYALIVARFLASQCKPATFDRTTVRIDSGPVEWAAEGAVLVDPGFLHFWRPYARQEDVELPAVAPGQRLHPEAYTIDEKQTSPPPRYDTGALIRKLELSGIGRPATFASIVETLLRRDYVVEVTTTEAKGATSAKGAKGTKGGKRVLQPTPLGLRVDGLLTASFGALVSEGYTAEMEAELDRIERREGETRPGYLKRWYADFRSAMRDALTRAAAYRAEHGLDGRRGGQRAAGGASRGEETAIRCDRCGEACYRKLSRRTGRGTFLACPECRLTRDVRARTKPDGCPKCGSTLIERRGKRKGVRFFGCVRYGAAERACDYVEWSTPKPGDEGARREARGARGAKSTKGAKGTKSTSGTKGATGVKRARAGAASAPPAERREATTKRCPRCAAAALDVVTPAAGAAHYACPAPGCRFTLPVGARRRGTPCPRCGGVVLERRAAATRATAPAVAWACARAGCDYEAVAS